MAAWKEANQGVLTTKMKAEVPNSGYRHPYQRPISRKTASPSSSDMRKSNVEGRDETVLAPLSLFHFGGFYKLARYIISVFQPLLYWALQFLVVLMSTRVTLLILMYPITTAHQQCCVFFNLELAK